MKKYLIFLYSILYTGKSKSYLRFFFSGLLMILIFSIGRGLNTLIIQKLAENIDIEYRLIVYTRFHSILGFILVSIASMSCIIYSFNVFFKDRELYFLFSLPVKTSEIFFNRFMKIFIYSSSVYILFSAGIVSSLGSLLEAGHNIFTLILSYLCVPLIYTSLSILTVFLFTLILGSINSKRFLISFSVFMITLITVAVRYMRPESLFQMNNIELEVYMNRLSMPFLRFSPGDIPSRVMLYLSQNSGGKAFILTFLCLLFSFLLFFICSSLYKRLHNELSGSNESSKDSKTLDTNSDDSTKRLFSKKEIILFMRDNFNLQQLWLFAGLIAVLFFNAYYLKDMGKQYDAITFFFNLGVILLICASFIARFFFGFFKDTKREIIFIRALPVDTLSLFKARKELFFIACLIFSLFGLGLLSAIYIPSFSKIVIAFIDILLFIPLYINIAMYISLRFVNERLEIFSVPVLFYIIFNLALTFVAILIQSFGLIGIRHTHIVSGGGKIGSVILVTLLIVFFTSGIFKNLSLKRIKRL